LIQTRSHVRNAIASRERQVVMRKVKSTITFLVIIFLCMDLEDLSYFHLSCHSKTPLPTTDRTVYWVRSSRVCGILHVNDCQPKYFIYRWNALAAGDGFIASAWAEEDSTAVLLRCLLQSRLH